MQIIIFKLKIICFKKEKRKYFRINWKSKMEKDFSLVKYEWLIKKTCWFKEFNYNVNSNFVLKYSGYLLNHISDKQLSLCCLILIKKDQDCKDYQRVQNSGWKNNDNAGENLYWSLIQFHRHIGWPYHWNHV